MSRCARLRKLLCLGLLLPGPAVAVDDGLAQYALFAKVQNIAPATPWITRLSIARETNGEISRADGTIFMERPRVACSSYDRSVCREISRFYRANKMRVNAVVHYASRRVGEIFSFGFDTGYSAEKISLKPSVFIGYARAYRAGKRTYFAFALGGWFGGKIAEQSCLDTYGREYYCPSLTAWQDYRPPEHRLHRYLNLVFRRDF